MNQESQGEQSASFKTRVWEAIRAIPPGEVRTYREIGEAIGSRSWRAVGQACSQSPGMPDVPCHRVVNSRMCLHGFNGGIEAKRALLESEGLRLERVNTSKKTDYRVLQ